MLRLLRILLYLNFTFLFFSPAAFLQKKLKKEKRAKRKLAEQLLGTCLVSQIRSPHSLHIQHSVNEVFFVLNIRNRPAKKFLFLNFLSKK